MLRKIIYVYDDFTITVSEHDNWEGYRIIIIDNESNEATEDYFSNRDYLNNIIFINIYMFYNVENWSDVVNQICNNFNI